jgi:D-methionine transport system ATP-binding protein
MSVIEQALAAAAPVLRVRNLECVFGKTRVVHGVSFDVRAGERLGIVGSSGAGKSTLLRCLNLLVTPAAGTVELDGRSLLDCSPAELSLARHQLGMVFQHFALLHRRTVAGNVALPLEIAGLKPGVIGPRVREVLERVRLTDKAGAWPAQLSGGQRQRVGIARALVHAPRVLLCDEPTSALDAETAKHVTELLATLSHELGLTVVFVTHQLELVRRLADEVLVLDAGRIVERTRTSEFFALPRSEAGQRLLASA